MNRVLAVFQTSLTRLFMSGLLAILPLVLTVAIIGWVANFLRSYLGPETMVGELIRSLGVQLDGNAQGTAAYLLGVVVVVSALIGLGILFELGAKKIYQATLEWVMRKIPLVGNLYGSLRQLIELFDKSEQTELKAMSVVYCYFGSLEGSGVLALMPSSEVIEIEGRKHHVVIIPTAPVPFGGGLIFFPIEHVRRVEMTVDQFVSIYVSMGVTTPEFFAKKKFGKTALHSNQQTPPVTQ